MVVYVARSCGNIEINEWGWVEEVNWVDEDAYKRYPEQGYERSRDYLADF